MAFRDYDQKRNRWNTQSQELVFDTPIFQLFKKHCQSSESDETFQFYVICSLDWCNVIPVTTEGEVVFVRQHRAGTDEHSLEVPGGIIDATDENQAEAAIREMTEETGYAPTTDAKVTSLGWNYPNPAIQNNRCYSFVVGPVEKKTIQNLDQGEMIDVVTIPIDELPKALLDGTISHSLILNAFFFLLLKNPNAQTQLQKALSEFQK